MIKGEEKNRKVVILGFDGTTFDLIRPWIDEGKLPTFAKLMKEGSYGALESTPCMSSPPAWTSFSTGKNPGGHGVYSFMDITPGTLDMYYRDSTFRDGETMWSLFNKAGKKAIVLNVPMTYPADKLDGCMVSGWNAPGIKSEGFTYPPDLIDELLEKFNEYPIFPTVKKNMVSARPDLAIKELHRELDIKASVTKYLMKSRPWDLVCSVFLATDQVQHYFWHYMDKNHPEYDEKEARLFGDAILDVYKKCDSLLADIIKDLSDDTSIIVMSDHGNGINAGGVQFMIPWLTALGLMVDLKNTPPSFIAHPLLSSKIHTKNLLKKQYLWMNNNLSVKAKGFLNNLLPGIRDRVESSWRLSTVDWSKTRCFFHYMPRINLKGREAYGIVSPGKEYEQLSDYVISKLYESRDIKTGKPIVKEVLKGEDVYRGKYINLAPDMMIRWNDSVISGIVCTDENGKEVRVTEKDVVDHRSGNHTPKGIFIAKGKDFKKGLEVQGLELIDIAPTVLYLMGMPIPEDVDGKVAEDIFLDEFSASHSTTYSKSSDGEFSDNDLQGYSPEEEEKVAKTLRDMGYIE